MSYAITFNDLYFSDLNLNVYNKMSKDILKCYATKPFNVLSHELHEFFSQSTFNDNEENVRLSYILTNMSICCIHELNICPVRIHARTGNYEKSPNERMLMFHVNKETQLLKGSRTFT